MAEAFEGNCCGLPLRETGTKKDLHLYGGKKKLIFCLDFLFCFIYKLAFASDKKEILKWTKKCLHTITYTTIITITTPPSHYRNGPSSELNQALWVVFRLFLTDSYDLFGLFQSYPCAFTRSTQSYSSGQHDNKNSPFRLNGCSADGRRGLTGFLKHWSAVSPGAAHFCETWLSLIRRIDLVLLLVKGSSNACNRNMLSWLWGWAGVAVSSNQVLLLSLVFFARFFLKGQRIAISDFNE